MAKKSRILALVLFLAASAARAAVSPIGVSLVPPIEFPPDDFTIGLLRVSALWGETRNVYGIDLGGLGNITEGSFGGLAVAGGFNVTHGESTVLGLQAAGITNVNTQKVHVYGLQVAGGLNLNEAESRLIGVELALANSSPYMTVGGLQVGLYNRAREVYGLQVGLINVVENLHGLQIGLVNFNRQGLFSVAPILNFGF